MSATRSRPHQLNRWTMSLNKARRRVLSLDANNLFQQHKDMAGVLRVQAVAKYVAPTKSVFSAMSNGRVKLGRTAMTVRFRACGQSGNSKKMRDGNVLLSVTCHRPARKRYSSNTKENR